MIIYITGGERSGKSKFAQSLISAKCENPVFLATARVMDKEMEERVRHHKLERNENWQLIEEPLYLSQLNMTGRHVLLDCITLWLANVFYENKTDLSSALKWAKKEWGEFINQQFELVVVSNEIGMGLHGLSEETRLFTQLQGFMNQYIASMSDEAWLMVSGIPLKLK